MKCITKGGNEPSNLFPVYARNKIFESVFFSSDEGGGTRPEIGSAGSEIDSAGSEIDSAGSETDSAGWNRLCSVESILQCRKSILQGRNRFCRVEFIQLDRKSILQGRNRFCRVGFIQLEGHRFCRVISIQQGRKLILQCRKSIQQCRKSIQQGWKSTPQGRKSIHGVFILWSWTACWCSRWRTCGSPCSAWSGRRAGESRHMTLDRPLQLMYGPTGLNYIWLS